MAENRKAAADSARDRDAERAEKARQADDERNAGEAGETGHQANVNQVRNEPVPASHHDDRGQEAVTRDEEHARGKHD